jgi:hypothetical protein
VDPAGGDFRLQPRSPAIDRASVLAEVGVDLTGAPRGGNPDIGAYEFGATGGGGPSPIIGKLPPPRNFRMVVR